MKLFITICFCLAFSFISIAQQPELIFPVGHTESIRTARFSKNDEFIVTAGMDKTINIWETKTGKKIKTLEGPNTALTYAFFSDDNRWLVAGTNLDVMLWSIPSYKLMGNFDKVRRVFFTPDNQRIFLSGYDGTTKQVLLKTMQREQVYTDSIFLKIDYYGLYNSTAISPNSKLVTFATPNGLVINDILTGKMLSKIEIPEKILKTFFAKDDKLVIVTTNGIREIENVKSPDVKTLVDEKIAFAFQSKRNRYLLTSDGNRPNPLVKIWDYEKNTWILRSDTLVGRADTVLSFNDKNEMQYQINKSGFPGGWISRSGGADLELSDDGKFVRIGDQLCFISDYSSSYYIDNNTLRVSDISQDNRYILIQTEKGVISLMDVKTQEIVQNYRTRMNNVKILALNPTGKVVLYGTGDERISARDITTGRLLYELKHDDAIVSASFNSNGSLILTNSLDSTAKLWDAITGNLNTVIEKQHGLNNPAYFMSDGKVHTTQIMNDTIPVHDINDVKKIVDYAFEPIPYSIQYLNFQKNKMSRTGRFTLDWIGSALKLQDGQGSKAYDIDHSLDRDKLIHGFTEDEKLLAFASNIEGDTLKIWDLNKGKFLYINSLGIESNNFRNTKIVTQLFFTKNNQYLIVVDGNSNIHVLSGISFKKLYTVPGQSCAVSDNSEIMAVINKGCYEIHNFKSNRFLYRFLSIDTANYLMSDAQHRYDGTAEARNLIYLSCGNEILELDQFKDLLWVPNLTERLLKNEIIRSPALSAINICGVTPKISAAESGNNYKFIVTPRRGGLSHMTLAINGIEVKEYKPGSLINSEGKFQLNIPKNSLDSYLAPGKRNRISLKAFTKTNNIPSRAVEIEASTPLQSGAPNFYAVMVGISDYKGEELDLRYAAKDATNLSEIIGVVARKLLNTDSTEHVFMYNVTTSDSRTTFPEKQAIKNVFEEIGRKSKPNDFLFIFFAGHGTMDGVKKQFYFLTADASLKGSISATGISMNELSEWMKPDNIKAQKRLLVFDACYSGQAINDLVTIGDKTQHYVAARDEGESDRIKAIEKLNERAGFFVLSASASNQQAYEMDRYSQGLLTYSLLKAIKEYSVILDDGRYLNVDRWFSTVEKIISDLGQFQKRQQPQKFGTGGFNIGIVDNEVISKIVLPEQTPLFISSNFQNNDQSIWDDDLDLGNVINQKLNEISISGMPAKISFLPVSNSPDAWSLTGRYELTDSGVIVRVNVKRKKEILHRFEITGNKSDIKGLAGKIAEKALTFVHE